MFKETKVPLVVGYKGEIGSFILQGLLKKMPKALNILCYDINETRIEQITRIKKSNIIFLCVPIEKTIDWFDQNMFLLEGKIIVEQCSLKKFLYEYLTGKKWYFQLYSMHLLFRTSINPDIKDRNCIIYNNDNYYPNIRYFSQYIASIIDTKIDFFNSIQDHDCLMAQQQALVHRVLLTLGEQINTHTSTTYIGKQVLALTERIKSGDPTLYKLIQENEYVQAEVDTFISNIKKFNI